MASIAAPSSRLTTSDPSKLQHSATVSTRTWKTKMTTTLRKACRSCTTSKRKCIVQLPKCTRCLSRGLDCYYDLEPVNAPTAQPNFDPSSCRTPGYCIMNNLKFRFSDKDPAICGTGHEDTYNLIHFGFESIPALLREGKPAVFVHPKLHLPSCYNHMTAFGENGDASYETLESLTRLGISEVPMGEALSALQALLIYLAKYLFFSGQDMQSKTEKHLNILSRWTQQLLENAQIKKPQNQTPWQEWLFGESLRRTIIMSYALSMAYTSFNNGYCSNWLFLESLPFERRAGLWMADSVQGWIASARVRNGEEVGEHLISFHEFAENLDGLGHDFCGDRFLALLAFGHNGSGKRENGPGGN